MVTSTVPHEFPYRKHDTLHNLYCKVCHKDFSCSHQGIVDIRRHEKSKAHISTLSTATSSWSLSDIGFVRPIGSHLDIQANVLFTLYS